MLPFVVLSVNLFAQKQHKQSITISGKVAQSESLSASKTIRLTVRSLIGDNAPVVSTIDTNGRFDFTVPLTTVQDITIYYGNPISLLCQPGDKINMRMRKTPDGKHYAEISGLRKVA